MRHRTLAIVTALAAMLIVTGRAKAEEEVGATSLLVEMLQKPAETDFQIDILKGLREALRGKHNLKEPPGWAEAASVLSKSSSSEVHALVEELALLFGDKAVAAALRQKAANAAAKPEQRLHALESLLEARVPNLSGLLLDLTADPKLSGPAIRALAGYDDPRTPEILLQVFPKLTDTDRQDALSTLAVRVEYALPLIAALKAGVVPRQSVTAFTFRQLEALGNVEINTYLAQTWGSRRTSEETLAEIAKYKQALTPDILRNANPSNGRAVFVRSCQTCHSLFGTGGNIGPDLTGSNRADLDYVLLNVIDPSAIVAKEHQVSILKTRKGRVFTGVLVRDDAETITIRNQNETVVVARTEIDTLKSTAVSLMPEGLLNLLPANEVRDLIFYLRSLKQVPLPILGQ